MQSLYLSKTCISTAGAQDTLMKFTLFISALLLIFSCNPSADKAGTDSTVDDEEFLNTNEEDSDEEEIDAELSPESHQLLLTMEGNYFVLDHGSGIFSYLEDCAYNEGEISIRQKLDNVAFWGIEWYGEWIDIHSVTETEREITVSNLEEDLVFIFRKQETEFVFEFIVAGYRDSWYLAKSEHIQEFEIISCDNILRIISDLPDTYYLLTEIDGEEVIYYPCYAPDVIIMDGETIDFSSGSDPYPIESMEKLFNRIVVRYMPADTILDSIIINRVNENIYTISTDESNAKRYVREEAIGLYKEVNEGCE